MCDIAHAILVERVERAALARYQAALVRGIEAESVEDALRRFDERLHAKPEPGKIIDPAQMALRKALGVA